MADDGARGLPDRSIVVVNTNADVVNLLCTRLELEGYRTLGVPSEALKAGRSVVYDVLYNYDPDVIVWGVSIPYDTSWAYLQRVRASVAALGRTFIITTANKRALERVVGPVEAIEVSYPPDDLTAVVSAVSAVIAPGRARDDPLVR
jgi:hypothetical protein